MTYHFHRQHYCQQPYPPSLASLPKTPSIEPSHHLSSPVHWQSAPFSMVAPAGLLRRSMHTMHRLHHTSTIWLRAFMLHILHLHLLLFLPEGASSTTSSYQSPNIVLLLLSSDASIVYRALLPSSAFSAQHPFSTEPSHKATIELCSSALPIAASSLMVAAYDIQTAVPYLGTII